MSTQDNTAKYIELSNEAYGLIVDTFVSATRDRLAYWKAVWGIASRPYASTAIARENFDRARACFQMMSLRKCIVLTMSSTAT